MGWHHLTQSKRTSIMNYRNDGETCRQIAIRVGCAPSTVCREIKRNGPIYHDEAAEQRAGNIRHRRRPRKLDEGPLQTHVITRLKEKDSPDEISGRLKFEGATGKRYVSRQTIYSFIKDYKENGEDLRPHLRRFSAKPKRKDVANGTFKRIQHTRSIEQRPKIVESRKEFGHFESDSVRGKMTSSVGILTSVERMTRFLIAARLSDRKADTFTHATIVAFAHHPALQVRSLTVDNGMEFAKHKELEEALNTQVYFCHPYRAGERGTNENTNGLLRQFLPKGTDLSPLADEQLQMYVDNLNNRPRKCLGYRTPAEVFHENLVAIDV